MAYAETQILDYTNAQLITLKDGTARIQEGTFKIIHIIDTRQYDNLTKELENTIAQNIQINHPLHPFLNHEIIQIRTLLSKLTPRVKHKRSLDFIGTAWKWIAGNPDHHDLEIINKNIGNLLENNDRQVIINKKILDKINEASNNTNEILKSLKNNENVKLELSLKIKYKLQLIKEELINIEYALHWAKSNIVNSFILSNLEISTIEKIIGKEEIPYINIEEELEFTDIRIASNGTSIIYILSLPTTNKETCEKIILKGVKKENKINKIDYEKILKCKTKIYGLKNECRAYNKITICNEKDFIEINNNSCISNLINSRRPNCTLINADHISNLEELQPGILFLNNYNGLIEIDGKSIELNGTFIIQHHNSTINVQNKNFYVHEMSNLQPLPPVLQKRNPKTPFEEILSLQMMKGLQIQNLKKLETINKINKVGLTSNTALTISIIIAVILIALKISGKRKPKDFQGNCNKPNALGTPESTEMRTGTSALEEGGANATAHTPQPKYDGNPTPHTRNVLASATVHTPQPKYDGNPTPHLRNAFAEIPEQQLAFPWETPSQQRMGHVAGTRA